MLSTVAKRRFLAVSAVQVNLTGIGNGGFKPCIIAKISIQIKIKTALLKQSLTLKATTLKLK